jgi:hypothetical protein
MKISKIKLRRLIKEEFENDEALLDAIGKLTGKIQGLGQGIEDLDISIDFLSAAFVGGDPKSIGGAQKSIGRAYVPRMPAPERQAQAEPRREHKKITNSRLKLIVKEELAALLGEEELQEDKEGKGKCPSDGCVQAREGHWVVISNKTGECWGRSKKEGGKCTQYDSREDAEGALGAYHA